MVNGIDMTCQTLLGITLQPYGIMLLLVTVFFILCCLWNLIDDACCQPKHSHPNLDILIRHILVPTRSFLMLQAIIQYAHVAYIIFTLKDEFNPNLKMSSSFFQISLRISDSGIIQVSVSSFLWYLSKEQITCLTCKEHWPRVLFMIFLNLPLCICLPLIIMGFFTYIWISIPIFITTYLGLKLLGVLERKTANRNEPPSEVPLLGHNDQPPHNRSSQSAPPSQTVSLTSTCYFLIRLLLIFIPKLFVTFGFVILAQTLCHYMILLFEDNNYLDIISLEYNLRNLNCYVQSLWV